MSTLGDGRVEMEEEETRFLDAMYPVLCYTCGENVADRVDEYSELLKTNSVSECFEQIGISNNCTKSFFITGGSNMRAVNPCHDCIRGYSCALHSIWKPLDVARGLEMGRRVEESQGEKDRGGTDVVEESERNRVKVNITSSHRSKSPREDAVPIRDQVAKPSDFSHLPKVSIITNLPKKFGLPVHLKEYDEFCEHRTLDSRHKVKVMMGQLYKI